MADWWDGMPEDERRAFGPMLRDLVPGISESSVRTVVNLPRSTYCLVFAFSAVYLPTTGNNCCTQYSIVFTFVLLALVLAVRPQGLFGREA